MAGLQARSKLYRICEEGPEAPGHSCLSNGSRTRETHAVPWTPGLSLPLPAVFCLATRRLHPVLSHRHSQIAPKRPSRRTWQQVTRRAKKLACTGQPSEKGPTMLGTHSTLVLAVTLLGVCSVSGSEWAGKGSHIPACKGCEPRLHAATIAPVRHLIEPLWSADLGYKGLDVCMDLLCTNAPPSWSCCVLHCYPVILVSQKLPAGSTTADAPKPCNGITSKNF